MFALILLCALFALAGPAIKGPLVGRLEVGLGRSALGGPLISDTGWVAGARIGLGAETPVGPVRFEYGAINEGRGTYFVRLGRLF